VKIFQITYSLCEIREAAAFIIIPSLGVIPEGKQYLSFGLMIQAVCFLPPRDKIAINLIH